MDGTTVKARKPWLAGLLSLVVPGLGQIYNGQAQKAAFYLVLFVFGTPLVLFFSPAAFVVGYFILLSIRLYLVADAIVVARRVKGDYRLKSYNNWYTYTAYAAGVLLIGVVMRESVVQAYKVPAGSMYPTLQIGDHFWVNKLSYGIRMPITGSYLWRFAKPQRGDVITFIFPEDQSKDFVKRVMAVEGEDIEIRGKKVFINGQPIEDPYAYLGKETSNETIPFRDDFGAARVPPGHIFVMGDNRDKSYDSRFWRFLKVDDVKGKAFAVYWSWVSEEHAVRWERIGVIIK